LIWFRLAIGSMVMMSENVHQRTGQKKQIGRRRERMAGMRRQQVDTDRCSDGGYSQPKPGTEETIECVHGRSICNYRFGIVFFTS
jgi:hypothetical protein